MSDLRFEEVSHAYGVVDVVRDVSMTVAAGGYAEYKRASLHTIAAGLRVPYELLTGDLSQVNYGAVEESGIGKVGT